MVLLLPEAVAIEFRARDLIQVNKGHAFGGSDIGTPLGLRLADDESLVVAGIARGEGHEDGIGTLLTDLTDIAAKVVTIAIDRIRYLLAEVKAHNHGILCHTVNYASGALGVEKVSMVVMSYRDDDPVAGLQGLAHGWPEVGIEVAGGHAAQSLVLYGDLPAIEEVAGKVAPAPLAVVAIAHRAVAHGGVADEEEHRVRALTCGAGGRAVHQGLSDRVGSIIYYLLFATGRGQVVECLRS